jgi:hypothetical protein
MTYNPASRPRHPVQVAYLSDAALLVQVADKLDADMDGTLTVPARQALAHAAVILRGASNTLRS